MLMPSSLLAFAAALAAAGADAAHIRRQDEASPVTALTAVTTELPSLAPTQSPTATYFTTINQTDAITTPVLFSVPTVSQSLPAAASLSVIASQVSVVLPNVTESTSEWSMSETASAAAATNTALSDTEVDLHKRASTNLFTTVATDNPGSYFGARDHVLSPVNVDWDWPIETNKFYTNLLLGSRSYPAFLEPYTVYWSQGSTNNGMCISHVDDSQKVYKDSSNPTEYFVNALGLCSLAISATNFDSNANLSLSYPRPLSVTAKLTRGSSSISMPLVLGQAFITAWYSNATPKLFTTFAITKLVKLSYSGAYKYRVYLNDGKTWVIYAYAAGGSTFSLTLNGTQTLVGSSKFNGFIQIAKNPVGSSISSSESHYDAHAGTYATDVTPSAYASGSSATYTLDFTLHQHSNRWLLHWALPHIQKSITLSPVSGMMLTSPSKGHMAMYIGNSWTMEETDLPTDIDFLPNGVSASSYTSSQKSKILAAAQSEIAQDFDTQTNLDSMYYSGKALAKFASICLAVNDVLANETLSALCVQKLSSSMSRFVDNDQQYPLIYDKTWGGLVSTQGFTQGSSSDFGNTYYNDHHFHYGYFVYTAAVLGHISPSWLTTKNKKFINNMVRDVANPSPQDAYYPRWRSFCWFHGHSWAKGLFESGDGKDEESSSEDYNFVYGMKLWGKVTGDSLMESRANLMLAVERRAMNSYMLMGPSNTVMPSRFRDNYVSGILFEYKADHTTYFSSRTECIAGIHMLPSTAISPYIRTSTFVKQEWSAQLASLASSVTDGWRGIIYADYAIYAPQTAYNFFSGSSFSSDYLDGGASLTWYLTFTAGLLQSK